MNQFKTFILAILALSFVACSSNDKQTVGFYLTDAPASSDIAAVFVDVRAVSYTTLDENWTDVAITPTLVNLLDYQNGNDTLLAAIELESGIEVQQVRLLLGSNNYIVLTDGSEHAIETPSAQESGLKINVQSEADVHSDYKVVIDFDASRSIVKKGTGEYQLKPVIRAYISTNTSSIYGKMYPSNIPFRVFTITPAGDTISTISDVSRDNRFVLHGLGSGTYDIKAQYPGTGLTVTLKTNLSFSGGIDFDTGLLQFN